MTSSWDEWLRRLRHDLVKRLLWPARDRADMGGPVHPGELVVALIDEEGNPTTAEALWGSLCQTAPEPEHAALALFGQALVQATTAAARDDLATVLTLQRSFDQLVRDLAGKSR